MPWDRDEIRRLVEKAWAAMLGLEIRPAPDDTIPDWPGDVLTGAVTVAGPWSGLVALACPAVLARRFAAVVFAVPPERVADEQCRDVLGELTNVLGGGLKALLPGRSTLGLPVVTAAGTGTAGDPLDRMAFRCLDQTVLLTIHSCRSGSA